MPDKEDGIRKENEILEINGMEGSLPPGKIAIVASRYNPAICDSMVHAAVETLLEAGYHRSDLIRIRVPGAWELPLAVKQMLDSDAVVAAIALGCVIQGETTHDEHINRAVSTQLMQLSLETNLPIAFGLLTCNTLEQAIQRSGGTVGNKGNESADAIMEMLRLRQAVASLRW